MNTKSCRPPEHERPVVAGGMSTRLRTIGSPKEAQCNKPSRFSYEQPKTTGNPPEVGPATIGAGNCSTGSFTKFEVQRPSTPAVYGAPLQCVTALRRWISRTWPADGRQGPGSFSASEINAGEIRYTETAKSVYESTLDRLLKSAGHYARTVGSALAPIQIRTRLKVWARTDAAKILVVPRTGVIDAFQRDMPFDEFPRSPKHRPAIYSHAADIDDLVATAGETG